MKFFFLSLIKYLGNKITVGLQHIFLRATKGTIEPSIQNEKVNKTSLEIKSQQLKKMVSEFEEAYFLGTLSLMMYYIPSHDKFKSTFQGLHSPLRQIYYLAGLNISSAPSDTKKKYLSQEDWNAIKELLIEIEKEYMGTFYPTEEEYSDEEAIYKKSIAMQVFFNYFNLGVLNYEEQILERVNEYFSPFSEEIKKIFGIELNDFIDIYNFIDKIPNDFLLSKKNKGISEQEWVDFVISMIKKGIKPTEFMAHMPDSIKKSFDFAYDNGLMNRFSVNKIITKFGLEKTNLFLKNISLERRDIDYT